MSCKHKYAAEVCIMITRCAWVCRSTGFGPSTRSGSSRRHLERDEISGDAVADVSNSAYGSAQMEWSRDAEGAALGGCGHHVES